MSLCGLTPLEACRPTGRDPVDNKCIGSLVSVDVGNEGEDPLATDVTGGLCGATELTSFGAAPAASPAVMSNSNSITVALVASVAP